MKQSEWDLLDQTQKDLLIATRLLLNKGRNTTKEGIEQNYERYRKIENSFKPEILTKAYRMLLDPDKKEEYFQIERRIRIERDIREAFERLNGSIVSTEEAHRKYRELCETYKKDPKALAIINKRYHEEYGVFDKSDEYSQGYISATGYKELRKERRKEKRIGDCTIEREGTLGFREWSSMVNSVEQYVMKNLDTEEEYHFYSNIDFNRSSEDIAYQQVLKEQLLDPHRIEVANRYNGGYIGDIVKDEDGNYTVEYDKATLCACMEQVNRIQSKDRLDITGKGRKGQERLGIFSKRFGRQAGRREAR